MYLVIDITKIWNQTESILNLLCACILDIVTLRFGIINKDHLTYLVLVFYYIYIFSHSVLCEIYISGLRNPNAFVRQTLRL